MQTTLKNKLFTVFGQMEWLSFCLLSLFHASFVGARFSAHRWFFRFLVLHVTWHHEICQHMMI